MTRQQAAELEANADEAEALAHALHDHPLLDLPDYERALLDLAAHHHSIAREVIRVSPAELEAGIIDSFLAQDRANYAALEDQLAEADVEVEEAMRQYRSEVRLAIAATVVFVIVAGAVGALVSYWLSA